MPAKSSGRKRGCLYIPLVMLGLLVLALAASALSNLGLPQKSKTVDQLSQLEKARLSEAFHLRSALGDAAWPGFSTAKIPVILYNEKYAFLVGYPDPPPGWKRVPSMEQRGNAWEAVPGDSFEGQPYYRSPITDPTKTPQSFTVLVGDRWVATFQTREYSQVSFYRQFRKDLPPFLSTVVPLRLVWALLMGKTDAYIAALEHESFHAFEGTLDPDRLLAAESMYPVMDGYPFDSMENAWKQEIQVLLDADQANTDAEAADLARQFLQLRDSRREALSPDQIKLEKLREWEEGLGKYVELEITRLASDGGAYQPVAAINQDPAFKDYRGRQQFWKEQMNEAANMQGITGDTRFYYSGNALAVLLDRLAPGWKAHAVPGGENLDDLLREAVK